ncbi:MAG: hypothetical protein M3Q24_00410 [bacterium]|nr:hypothetical protein [bacterium]
MLGTRTFRQNDEAVISLYITLAKAGEVIEVKTLHHTYTVVILDPQVSRVGFYGSHPDHYDPTECILIGSLTEDDVFTGGVIQSHSQIVLTKNRSSSEIITSYVVNFKLIHHSLKSWIARGAFTRGFRRGFACLFLSI